MAISQVKKICLILSLGVFNAISIIAPVKAEQYNVAPMVTISTAKSGQAKGSINVTNSGKEPLRMRVYAEDFTYDRKQGFTSTGNHAKSAVPYLQFSPRELVIPPGVTRNVRVGTTLLPSLPDGEYRAVLFVEDLKERDVKANAGNAVIINTRIASVFYVSKGTTSADVQVNTAVWDNTAKKLNIVLSNKGKKTDYPNINWQISKDGQQVAKDRVLGVLVQSENERELPLKIGDKDLSLTSGNYTLSGEIFTDKNKSTPFNVKVDIP
jgi:P pilus assembly chaperone PapD